MLAARRMMSLLIVGELHRQDTKAFHAAAAALEAVVESAEWAKCTIFSCSAEWTGNVIFGWDAVSTPSIRNGTTSGPLAESIDGVMIVSKIV